MLPNATSVLFMTTISMYYVTLNRDWVVQFHTEKYNYTHYIVELWNVSDRLDLCPNNNEPALWIGEANNEKNGNLAKVVVTSLTGNAQPLSEYFCVKVTPGRVIRGVKYDLGGSSVSSVLPDTFEASATFGYVENQENRDPCSTPWNWTLFLELHGSKARAVFKIDRCECFSKMEERSFYFFQLKNDSKATDCGIITKDFQPLNISPIVIDEECEVSATVPLLPGKYCVRFKCLHQWSGEHNIYASVVQTVHGSSIVGSNENHEPTSHTYYYYFIGPVALVTIMCVIFLYFKKLRFGFQRAPLDIDDADFDIEKLIESADEQARKMEIVVFYMRSFEKFHRAVESLCNFFSNAWHIDQVYCDFMVEAEISVKGASWVEDVTEWKPNRQIVIVESEPAVLQDEARKDLKVLHPVEEDPLDPWFRHAIELLKLDTRSLVDYKHISVVRFQSIPDDSRMSSVVPNRRYSLPKHLFLLYCNILNLPSDVPSNVLKIFEEKMTSKWKEHLEDLVSSICEAVDELRDDPSLLEKSFMLIDDPHRI